MRFDPQRLRREYGIGELHEDEIDRDPIAQFGIWLQQAEDANLIEANAMCVSTVDAEGIPSSRVVLLKGFDAQGFVFATSYSSVKGDDLDRQPQVSLLFYWGALERQIRISGRAERVSAAESDAIFDARTRDSRISAAASPQSTVIPSREWLQDRVRTFRESLGEEDAPARPESWGGYRVVPQAIEFWQGRQNRLHDRLRFRRGENRWILERLAP